jgi:DNA invertase Pin-like site-specific DNA recombinase
MGRALFGIMATMAQLERDLISERVRTKVRQIIATGKKWGAPKKVFRRDLAKQDLEAGGSLRSVAAKYEVSHATIARIRDSAD